MGQESPTFAQLLRDARGLDAAAFAGRYPTPYLLVVPLAAEEKGEWSFDTVHVSLPEAGRANGGGLRVSPEWVPPAVHPVRKEGVVNPTLVTVGRTRTSDIWLDSKAISKLHAYFSRDPITGAYTLSDAGSTNGTTLAGKRLAQSEPAALRGGEEILLGQRFRAHFLLPEQLRDFVLSLAERR